MYVDGSGQPGRVLLNHNLLRLSQNWFGEKLILQGTRELFHFMYKGAFEPMLDYASHKLSEILWKQEDK
jgi:hypothetical protein